MKRYRLLALIALAVLSPRTAHADSDGYYCVGRGYLAYQFGLAPASHRLHVIRTTGPEGIPEPVVLGLPQFQVHGMLCGEGWVDVTSFTAIYRVMLDKRERPVGFEVRRFPDGSRVPQEFARSQNQNLGSSSGARAYAKPVRVRLSAKVRGGEYLLEVIAKLIEPATKCELSITSRVVETDNRGREARERIIFQGAGRRECGE